jgi:hypothetical protein
MTLENGYYWRFDRNQNPVDVDIVQVDGDNVWVIGGESPMSIDYLTRDGITIVRIDQPVFYS